MSQQNGDIQVINNHVQPQSLFGVHSITHSHQTLNNFLSL